MEDLNGTNTWNGSTRTMGHIDPYLLEQWRTFNKVSSVLTPATIGLLLFIGLLGNLLVIFVSFSTQRIIKHRVHSVLVLNLAVSDITYLISSAPYQAISFTVSGWIYGPFLCQALHFLSTQTMTVSIFTMCSLAVMRFIALIMPFTIQRSFIQTSAKITAFLIVTIVWILGSVVALPNIIYFGLKPFGNAKNSSVSAMECSWDDINASKVNTLILLMFTYVLPFILVAVLYALIGREVFCYMRKKTTNAAGKHSEQTEYMKTTVMVFCLILGFLVCWLPHHLFKVIQMSKIYADRSYAITRTVMKLVGLCFSYAHACVNPIIYTFAAPGFRRSLHQSLKNKQSSNFLGRRTRAKSPKYSSGKPTPKRNENNSSESSTNNQEESATTMFTRLAYSIRRDMATNTRKFLEKRSPVQNMDARRKRPNEPATV